jgi:O-antigen ligase
MKNPIHTVQRINAKWPVFPVLLGGAMLWVHPSSATSTVLFVFLGVYGLTRARKDLAVWMDPTGFLFLAGILITVVSAAWSFDPSGTIRDLTKSAPLALGVLGLPAFVKDRNRVWQILLVSAAWVSAVLAWDLGRVVMALEGSDLLGQARNLRPYLYTHPNVSSMMAGMTTLVLGAAIVSLKCNWKQRVALLLAIAINLAYLTIMASRGPQLVFLLACVALPFLAATGWKWRCLFLCAAVLLGSTSRQYLIRINPRFGDKTMSGFHQRDVIWNHTRMLVEERPILGYGHGKKTFVKAVYENRQHEKPVSRFHYPHAHSYWLMLLFQGGFVALFIWGSAWLALGVRLLRWRLQQGRNMETGLSGRKARMLPCLLATLTGSILVYGVADFPDHIIRICQFLLAGLILGLTHREKAKEPAT